MEPEACPTAEELLAFHFGQLPEVRIDDVADHVKAHVNKPSFPSSAWERTAREAPLRRRHP